MKKDRMHELDRNRIAQLKMSDVCNGTVIGIFVLWVVWVSTSLLIHFSQ